MTGETTTIYLARHAMSAPSPELPEPDWPLSEDGKEQALNLRDRLDDLGIDRAYSSPFPRAVETVRPFCEGAGLDIEIEPDLKERKLTDRYIEDWYVILKRAWSDFDFALPNCESGKVCQERMKACIVRLATDNVGKVLLACSHGNAIGLYLNHLDDSFGFKDWESIQTPDLFRIVYTDLEPEWDKGFGLNKS